MEKWWTKRTRERRREAREKTVEGMEEMMEKAQGKLMLGSAGSSSASTVMRLREEKEELRRTAMRIREEKEELGRMAEGRVLSRHLAEAKWDEGAKLMRGMEKGRNWKREDRQTRENETDEHELLKHLLQDTGEEAATMMNKAAVTSGHGAATTKAMIVVAAAAAEIDRGETTTKSNDRGGGDSRT